MKQRGHLSCGTYSIAEGGPHYRHGNLTTNRAPRPPRTTWCAGVRHVISTPSAQPTRMVHPSPDASGLEQSLAQQLLISSLHLSGPVPTPTPYYTAALHNPPNYRMLASGYGPVEACGCMPAASDRTTGRSA
ncbi:MAG: hypothetical protein Q9173_004109 [Seirophora scorigena]